MTLFECPVRKNMKKQKGRALAIIGTICFCGPLVGLIGTIVAVLSAFQMMGSESESSPEALANEMSLHLISTAIGLCLGILGIILLLIALFRSKYRAPWFFWILCVLSALWTLGFPVGTIVGFGLLVYLLRNKAEFKPNKSSEPSTWWTPVAQMKHTSRGSSKRSTRWNSDGVDPWAWQPDFPSAAAKAMAG